MTSHVSLKVSPRPTEAEHAILQVLWRRGPCTVRDVHEQLSHRGTGYTTVLKILQIMMEKGLVARDEEQRSHVYRAAVEESATQRSLVVELIDRAFNGAASELVLNALSSKPTSREDLAKIRTMLDQLEKKRGR